LILFGWRGLADIVFERSREEAEFVKRSGYALMASLAFHGKKADDSHFLSSFPLVNRDSPDERYFVKKAANRALRQIDKLNDIERPNDPTR